jgi:hypothetical protein
VFNKRQSPLEINEKGVKRPARRDTPTRTQTNKETPEETACDGHDGDWSTQLTMQEESEDEEGKSQQKYLTQEQEEECSEDAFMKSYATVRYGEDYDSEEHDDMEGVANTGTTSLSMARDIEVTSAVRQLDYAAKTKTKKGGSMKTSQGGEVSRPSWKN